MSNGTRASLYDWRDGAFLTTIQTSTERSWVVDDFGKCSFTLSQLDAKTAQKYLDIDRLIYIEGNDGLDVWAGVIDTDIDWNDDGTITYSAYSGEHLLKYRISPLNQVWKEASAGALFERMVNDANAKEDLLIRIGEVWKGGGPAEDTMDGKNYYEHIKALAKNRGNHWSIEPAIDPLTHKLYFKANYYETIGRVRPLVLKEGFNIEKRSKPLRLRGDIVNRLTGIGAGSDEERKTHTEEDMTMRGRYRLREGTEDFTSETQASVTEDTVARLKQISKPQYTYSLTALNVGATFANIRKGDVLPLKMRTVGFGGVNTMVKVSKMRYFDKTDTMEITPDEDFTL